MSKMIRTQLGIEIEDSNNRTGKINLPGTWEERFRATASALCHCDYRGHVYAGDNPQGLRIFLIGESFRSRALAMHSEDLPGVVYLLKDGGGEIDISQPVIAEKAVWLGDLIAKTYLSVERTLALGEYLNNRLLNRCAIE